MAVQNSKFRGFARITTYTSPVYHNKKNCYVDFMAFDPAEGRLKRKKYMLDGIRKEKDRKARASELMAVLSAKLRSGWSPWMEGHDEREYARMDDVFDFYLRYVERLHAGGAMKFRTLQDYQSRINMLREFNDNRRAPILYAYQLDTAFISDFLDYAFIRRKVNARTRNNYKRCIATFCNWMIEKGYIKENPCDGIRNLIEERKFRSALSPEDMYRLKTYLQKENPYYLMLCTFAYYTFIRPNEIRYIRLCDINLKKQSVCISGDVAKNRRDQVVGLNDTLVKMMLDMKVFEADSSCYLFGKDFRPSRVQASTCAYRDYFQKIRRVLRLPAHYQFYSLKDTGIRDLANAEGIVIARDQARHSDIHTTNRYIKYEGTVHEETKHFKGLL